MIQIFIKYKTSSNAGIVDVRLSLDQFAVLNNDILGVWINVFQVLLIVYRYNVPNVGIRLHLH